MLVGSLGKSPKHGVETKPFGSYNAIAARWRFPVAITRFGECSTAL